MEIDNLIQINQVIDFLLFFNRGRLLLSFSTNNPGPGSLYWVLSLLIGRVLDLGPDCFCWRLFAFGLRNATSHFRRSLFTLWSLGSFLFMLCFACCCLVVALLLRCYCSVLVLLYGLSLTLAGDYCCPFLFSRSRSMVVKISFVFIRHFFEGSSLLAPFSRMFSRRFFELFLSRISFSLSDFFFADDS